MNKSSVLRSCHPPWSKSKIAACLTRLHAAGVDVSMSGVAAQARSLSAAMVHYFGNHTRALRAAGIKPETVAKSRPWTRGEVLGRLRQRRQQGQELSFTAIMREDSRLYGQIQKQFGGMAQAMAKLGVSGAAVGRIRRWTRPQIVAELRVLHRAGKRMSYTDLQASQLPLLVAARRHFGSWHQALAAAGIAKPPHRPRGRRPMIWTPQRIKASLRERHAQGLPLTAGAVRHAAPALYNGCTRRFGSFAKALNAAGLGRPKVYGRDKPWTRQGVIRTLHQHFAPGQGVSMDMLREHKLLSLLKGAREYFGSIADALIAAGLDYAASPGHRRRQWTRLSILTTLRQLHAQGVDLRPSRLLHSHQGLYRASPSVFGSFTKALAAAGIRGVQVDRAQSQWTPARIIQKLQQEHRAGHDLRSSALKRTHPGLSRAMRLHLGSHRQAIKAAGLPWPPKKPLANLSWPQVIAQVQALAKDQADLRYNTAKTSHQALFHAARYYFGRWAEAIAEAGLDYQELVHAATGPHQRQATLEN